MHRLRSYRQIYDVLCRFKIQSKICEVIMTLLLPLQDIEEFSFVTQLAGLTDHLSVAMRLAVSTGEEEP